LDDSSLILPVFISSYTDTSLRVGVNQTVHFEVVLHFSAKPRLQELGYSVG
jgi:hypothetical protein